MNTHLSQVNPSASILQIVSAILILIIVLGVNAARFVQLENSPPGFHVDELSGAVSVQCLSEEGIDALDNPYPLFADLNYGSPKPPTYIYPAVLWTKLFGYSIASFRAISGFVTVITIIGLYFLARLLFSSQAALWVIFSASLSPFVFQVSRIALEACLAPCFIVWGMYFFLKSHQKRNAILSGLCFAFAMYSYPPARLFIPIIFTLLVFYQFVIKKVKFSHFVLSFAVLSVTCIPLVLGTLSGEYMGRFSKIGIFSESYFADLGQEKNLVNLVGVFFDNYLKHLNPDFLFFKGDANLVYSTTQFGFLGWIETVAFILGGCLLIVFFFDRVKNRESDSENNVYKIVLLVGAILASIVPAALTWEDIPHSLRIICIWPFISLLTGYILFRFTQRVKIGSILVVILGVIFCNFYFKYYFFQYPPKAYWMFNEFTKEEVLAAKTKKDWLKFMYRYRRQNFHTRYYLMNYMGGQTCSSSQKVWKEVHKIK